MCEGLIGTVQKGGMGAGRLPQSLGEKKTLIVKPVKDERKHKVSARIFAAAAGTQQDRQTEQTDGGSCLIESATCGLRFSLEGISH